MRAKASHKIYNFYNTYARTEYLYNLEFYNSELVLQAISIRNKLFYAPR